MRRVGDALQMREPSTELADDIGRPPRDLQEQHHQHRGIAQRTSSEGLLRDDGQIVDEKLELGKMGRQRRKRLRRGIEHFEEVARRGPAALTVGDHHGHHRWHHARAWVRLHVSFEDADHVAEHAQRHQRVGLALVFHEQIEKRRAALELDDEERIGVAEPELRADERPRDRAQRVPVDASDGRRQERRENAASVVGVGREKPKQSVVWRLHREPHRSRARRCCVSSRGREPTEHCSEVPLDERRVEADDANAMASSELGIASRVLGGASRVVAAVDLDDELQRCCVEIDDERMKHVLTTELDAAEAPVAKRVPHERLGLRRRLAMAPSEFRESEQRRGER